MGWFSWIFGGSKSAARARQESMQARVDAKVKSEGRAWLEARVQRERAAAVSPSKSLTKDKAFDRMILQNEKDFEFVDVYSSPWYKLTSTNVDAIRYHQPTKLLHVRFLDTSIYEYEEVPSAVFMDFLRTRSPGQFRWYVLGDPRAPSGVHFTYRKIGGGGGTLPPMPQSRFAGTPFRISKKMQKILKKRPGTGASGMYARGVQSPPPAYTGTVKAQP